MMKHIYEFSLVLSEPSMTDELADRLYECGCDDSTIGSCEGVVTIDFDREADSLEDAMRSAIANVQAAGCTVAKLELEPETIALKV